MTEKYVVRAAFQNGEETKQLNRTTLEIVIRKINETLKEKNNDKKFNVYIDLIEE